MAMLNNQMVNAKKCKILCINLWRANFEHLQKQNVLHLS